MALEGFSGFELVNNLAVGWDPPFTLFNWTVNGGAPLPRTGAQFAQAYSEGAYAAKSYLANKATRVMGMACYFSQVNGGTSMRWSFHDGYAVSADNATCQVGIGVNSSGQFVAYRGRAAGSSSGGTLLGTATTPLPINTWLFVEIKVTVDNSAGVVEIKVDGTTFLSLTGQDTQNTANAYSNALAWCGGGNAGNFWRGFDDAYWLNTDGSAPDNDFLGDCVVRGVIPSTGNGTHQDSTPSTGTDRGALVDEATPTASDYNQISTPGDEDSYNYPVAGTTGTIIGLNIASLVGKSTAGTCTSRNLARISGTDYYGTTRNVSTTYGWHVDCMRVSPASGVAWTEAEINGAEFGVERVA